MVQRSEEEVMDKQREEDVDLFGRIVPWKQFRQQAAHLFPTESAFRWFIRTQDRNLVRAGALLKLTRGNYIDPKPFMATAVDLMRLSSSKGGVQ
jgi:hypothetical protein